ncbi:hypothetical protein Tco_0965691 [Tanacetum coccineum]
MTERKSLLNKKDYLIPDSPNSSSNTFCQKNVNLNKRLDSVPHKINEEELVVKLKFVAKGELKGKPTFRMPILEAMMSREVKESVAYVDNLAKYPNAQSHTPTHRRGQGKGYMRKDHEEALELAQQINLVEHQKQEKELRTKVIHATLVLKKDVNKQVDEAYAA